MRWHTDDVVPWPDDVAARYRRCGYWQGLTLGDVFRSVAARFPERTALVDDRIRMTYAEVDREVDRLAFGFLDRGLTAGERVVVHLPNRVETVLVLLALVRADALPVLALPEHRQSEIVHLHRSAGARGYVVGGDLPEHDVARAITALEAAGCAPEHVVVVGARLTTSGTEAYADIARYPGDTGTLPAPDPSEPALLLLSGGSTGLPKLIPRTHDDYAYNARAMSDLCGVTSDDVYLAALPVSHNFPLACPGVLGVLGRGGTAVLTRSANPAEAFEVVAREKVTCTSLVPALAAVWADAFDALAPKLDSLRLVQIGGAPLPVKLAQRVNGRLGTRLQQVFGMAEGLLSATRLDDPREVVETSQGRPLSPDDEMRIVDASDTPVPDGAVGELLVRGPYTLRGYFRACEHNATAFTADGFFRTGDLVRRTPRGNLVVEGRINDVINRGGEKVDPGEVEAHLRTHPQIAEAVVVPVPDPHLGQRVAACVRRRNGADRTELSASALGAFLRKRGVAAYKWPQDVRIVDQFPLTAVGKIDRHHVRQMVAPTTDQSAEGQR